MNVSDTIATDSLMRYLRATPEQRAAIDRFLLGGPGELGGRVGQASQGDQSGGADGLLEALARLERKVDAVRAGVADGIGPEVRVTEREAERVFLLMKRLEDAAKQRKAPSAAVFRLTVLEGHSQAKTARLCGCVPALISRRVKTIESRFGMSIEQLRSFASVILEMEASVKGDRVRKRKRGAPRDEPAQYDDGPGRPDLVEDANGYLPEEKPDYG